MDNQTALNPIELVSYTKEILSSLRLPPIDLPTAKKPGKMRGVDYYGQRLPEVMMECLRRYHRKYGKFPLPPLECKTINQKIFWSKFFVPMPIPTPADKLAVGKFIPMSVRANVRLAKVYWISDRPNFPSSIKGPDGHYFLKTNHSWRSVRKIKFPIEESERKELEALGKSWLAKKNYNPMGGEWWYSTIKTKLFIEEEISDDGENPKEYHFRCIEGKVVGITMSQRDAAGKENFDTAYNPDFSWNPGLKVIRSLPNIYNETPKNSESMLQIAGAIGKTI